MVYTDNWVIEHIYKSEKYRFLGSPTSITSEANGVSMSSFLAESWAPKFGAGPPIIFFWGPSLPLEEKG